MSIFTSEFVGTFVLVAAVLSLTNKYFIAFAFLVAIILASASGSHINPVITLVKHMQGAVSNNDLLQYIGGQVAGAIVALYIMGKL